MRIHLYNIHINLHYCSSFFPGSDVVSFRYEYVQKSNEGCFLQMMALDTVKPVLFLGNHGWGTTRWSW